MLQYFLYQENYCSSFPKKKKFWKSFDFCSAKVQNQQSVNEVSDTKMHRCRHPNGSNGSSAYVSAIHVPFNKAVLLQIRLYINCSMKFSDHSFLNPHVSIFLAKSGAILPFRIHSLNLQKTRFMCIIFAA